MQTLIDQNAIETLKKGLLDGAADDDARKAIEKQFSDFNKNAVDDPDAALAISEILKAAAKDDPEDDPAKGGDGGDDEDQEGDNKPDDVGKVFISLRKAVSEILADPSGADKAELLNESFGMAWDATANIANEAISKAFAAGEAAANPAGEPGNDDVMKGSDMPKQSQQALAAANAEIAKLNEFNNAAVNFLATASDADRAAFAKADDQGRRKVLKMDTMEDDVSKSGLPVELRKHFDKLEKRAIAAEQTVAKFNEEREIEKFAKRAVEIGQPQSFGEVLRKMHAADPEAAKALETELVAKNKQLEKSGLFAELGKSGEASDAGTRVNAKAEELRKANPKLSKQQAYAKALSPEDYEASLVRN